MVSREQRASQKRAQILKAAGTLFAGRGFDATSTDAVAEVARVSKETLYRYYPSKERLLVAVMRDMAVEGVFTGSEPRLAHGVDGVDRDRLEQVLCTVAEAIIDRTVTPRYAALARLVFAEGARRPELAETFRRMVPGAGAEGLTQILASAQQAGLLRDDIDLGFARRLFVGPLLTWTLAAVLGPPDEQPHRPATSDVRMIVRLFLDGVAVGGGSRQRNPQPEGGTSP